MRGRPRHAAPRGRLLHAAVPSWRAGAEGPPPPAPPEERARGRALLRRGRAALAAVRAAGRGGPRVLARTRLAALRTAWRTRPLLSRERRRARTLVAGAVVAAAVVVLTSFPLSEVLTQRSALRSTTHQLAAYTAADRDLSREVAALEEPGAAGVVARRDYGFVPAGDQAFDILPAAGSALPRSTASGYVPLDGGPVSPGSARSQALAGVPPLPPAPPATTHRHGAHDAVTAAAGGGDAAAGPSPGYWGRVLRSLEFWN